MFPPFPQEIALHYLKELSRSLDCGESELVQVAKESEERRGQGLMLGCLVCYEPDTMNRIVLFAVSGTAKRLVPGGKFALPDFSSSSSVRYLIAPPLVSSEEIASAVEKNDAEIHQLTEQIKTCQDSFRRSSLKSQRSLLCDESLKKVFGLYSFTRFDGRRISLNEIIARHGYRLPPTGTGECCAPRLLSAAFSRNFVPISMAEIFYGKDDTRKTDGIVYPPCDARCGYILPDILGLEILYRDRDIVVVNKAAGLLSVPGRGKDKQDCAEHRLRLLFPPSSGEWGCNLIQPAVHRLDMETSGILILAMNRRAHAELNRQFAEGLVQKKYIALLDGILRGFPEGRIEIKMRPDLAHRPLQVYDDENGKQAVTDWHKCGIEMYENPLTGEKRKITRVEFYPHTGRTHQLRLSSADFHGLGIAIVGDSLYGRKNAGERLMLHSSEIEFFHPRSQTKMKLCSPSPF